MTGSLRICVIGKYPPIQGGVSTQTYWMCRALAEAGHDVFVVTNADEVEPDYRAWLAGDDWRQLSYQLPGGGRVTARSSRAWDEGQYLYIPSANPHVSKLAAMAAQVVRDEACDMIFAFYLEPYGLAGNLAAQWTGVPFVLKHAGSDRYALMDHPDAGLAYREVMRQATAVITDDLTADGLGIDSRRVLTSPGRFLPREFSGTGPAADLNQLFAGLSAAGHPDVLCLRPLSPDLPVVGIYGKVGLAKGTVELLRATAEEARDGPGWQLVILGGGVGWHRVQRELDSGLASARVWRLPFLAPWHVPAFIRSCTAMCYLEHDFPIRQHLPSVAGEVLACGTPLVVSREAYDKMGAPGPRAPGSTFVVDSPADLVSLREAVGKALASAASGSRPAGRDAAQAHREEREIGTAYGELFGALLARPAGTLAPSGGREAADAVLRARCPVIWKSAQARPGAGLPQPTPLLAAYESALEAVSRIRLTAPPADAERALTELYLLWFQADTEGRAGTPAFPVPVVARTIAGRPWPEAGSAVPVLSRLVKAGQFTIDVPAYAGQLDSAYAPAGGAPWPAGGGLVLFQKFPRLGGRIIRAGTATGRLLELSDGRRTCREIAADVGIGTAGRDRFLLHLQLLLDADVLALAGPAVQWPPPPPARPWLDSDQEPSPRMDA